MIYSFDGLILDTELLELKRNGEAVGLEPQVFRLLLYLIENRDRVVDKEELVKEVWKGRVISDSAINSRINAARRAVGDDGRTQSTIKTFARRGFRFVKQVRESNTASAVVEHEPAGDTMKADSSDSRSGKPVIVVLPLHCVGDDDEGFGEGLQSMMITELSRRTGVDVISNQAAKRLSTQPLDFTQILNTVGADYALTGTVHRIGRQVRTSIELCETQHGKQIWSERYDRTFGDAFSLQDELLHLILMAVRWNIAAYDGERAARTPDSELSTADRLSRAAQHFYTPTPESYRAAAVLLDGVLQEEPRHAMALSMRAFAEYVLSTLRVTPMTTEERERTKHMVDLALDQNERSDFAHWVRGTLALNLDRDHDEALAHANRAFELNPHYSAALRLKGEVFCFSEDPTTGISMLQDLVAADPRAPGNAIAFWDMALGHFAIGDMKEALRAIDEALLRIRTMPDFYLVRSAVLTELGKPDDVALLVEHLFARYEGLSLSQIHRPPYKDDEIVEQYIRALESAGIPE